MRGITLDLAGILLFFIGLYGLCVRRNIVKSIIALGIMQNGIILFFLSIHFRADQDYPIVDAGGAPMVDPVPQALMITAVVIGIAITALSLMMFIKLYHKYGTTNWYKVKEKRKRLQ